MIKKILYSVVVFAVLSAGCSVYQIDSSPEKESVYYPPKKSPMQVVYLEALDKPHEIIGTVTVTTERRQALENILPKMQYEAAVLGGDAITDIQTDATGTWKKIKAQALLGNAYIRANYSAKVVVFK
ncbi:MAG: hypothetical protein KA403_07820 [Candidatus Omnitrophica bacterium]|nr:hypothetical protein [Candidatus Omnitrophota bacterium]